jgi:hypothetical protein
MGNRRTLASIFIFSVPLVAGIVAACGSDDSSTFNNGAGDAGIDVTSGPGFGDGGIITSGGDGGTHVDALSIAFTPASKTLTVDGVHSQTQDYQLVATLKSGGTVNGSPTPCNSIDPTSRARRSARSRRSPRPEFTRAPERCTACTER